MYRTLFPVLLYVGVVAAAPQESQDAVNSEVIYVKNQPFDRLTPDDHQPRSPFRESRIEILPLTIPGKLPANEPGESSRHTRSEVTTTSYETAEPTATEIDKGDELVDKTEEYEVQTRAPAPRFLSKLSYFKNSNTDRSSSIATNLVNPVGRPGRRLYKTACRCERIWNCPKLQITVPRCPTDYFLCCF